MFTIIAAIGRENELGKDGKLLWHLPTDMKFFKETTWGHKIIMGRKTFESFGGRLLPERTHLVLTASEKDFPEEVEQYHSVEEVLAKYAQSEEELFVIGGGTIYEAFLPYANRMLLTHVEADAEADTFFPAVHKDDWDISFLSEFQDSEFRCCTLEYLRK